MVRLCSIFLVLLLTSCGSSDVNKSDDWDRQVWVHPDTGCHYLFWQTGTNGSSNYAMALAPEIGTDGKPVCNKEKL